MGSYDEYYPDNWQVGAYWVDHGDYLGNGRLEEYEVVAVGSARCLPGFDIIAIWDPGWARYYRLTARPGLEKQYPFLYGTFDTLRELVSRQTGDDRERIEWDDVAYY